MFFSRDLVVCIGELVDLLDVIAEQVVHESKLVFEDCFQKLVVSTVQVEEDPVVKEGKFCVAHVGHRHAAVFFGLQRFRSNIALDVCAQSEHFFSLQTHLKRIGWLLYCLVDFSAD